MATTVQGKLIGYLHDAHAMEQGVLRMLDGMIAQTRDAEVLTQLRIHRQQTERHERLLRERLEALGSSPSAVHDVTAITAAWMKGFMDMMRSDKPGKNARDAYVTEHVEIAAYALLERLAERAGDLETARLARDLGADERDMADWIENHWDRFIDQTLQEDGIPSVWQNAPARPPAAFGGQRLAQAAGQLRDGVRRGADAAVTFTENNLLTVLGSIAGAGIAGYLLYRMTEPAPRRAGPVGY
jgi:ferritin-like metal-binding protein YciE